MMGVAILFPVLLQIVLTIALLAATGRARRDALMEKRVRLDDIALDNSRWPDDTRKFGNCYSNQFELPVLFYALCLAALQTANADYLMVLLAWAFVVSRILHAYIHTTSNAVRRRGAAFGMGVMIIAVMTLLLLARLLLARI